MTTFDSLRFETPQPGTHAHLLYLPGAGWPSYHPRDWVPFSSPPTTGIATVEIFETASTLLLTWCPSYITPWHGPLRKHSSSFLHLIVAMGTCIFAKPVLCNDSCVFSYLAVAAQ
jgi:hypothetical protein